MAGPESTTLRADDPSRLLPWLKGRSPIFARMDDRVARGLFALSTLRIEPRGATLIKQGERADALYIVIEGTLVTRVAYNKMTRDLFSHSPGEVAGLLGMFDQEPSPYEVYAVAQTQVVAVDLRKLWMYAAAYHPMAMAIHAAFTPALTAHLVEMDLRAGKMAQRKNASVAGTGEGFLRGERR